MSDAPLRFPFFAAPPQLTRVILVSGGMGILLMVLFPRWSLPILLVLTGPIMWALTQELRRPRGVRLDPHEVLIQHSLSGRLVRIPYPDLRGTIPTRRGGIGIAFVERPRPETPSPAVPHAERALSDLRPTPGVDVPLRPRFILTARIENITELAQELNNRRDRAGGEGLPAAYMKALAIRRRVRDGILTLLAVLGTPLYVIVIARILSGFV